MAKSRAYCIVDGCLNKTCTKSLSFFKLPKDEERRNKWLTLIGRSDLMHRDNLKPGSHIVCSDHFEKDMIFMTPRLNPDAMPTKCLPPPPSTSTSTSEMKPGAINKKNKNTTCETSSVQTAEINVDKQTQTTISLFQDTSGKRKLRNNIQESEHKRKRLEIAIMKIEKEIQTKHT